MGGRKWTDTELDQLEGLRLEGATAREIAVVMGRSVMAIKRKCFQEEYPVLNTRTLQYVSLFNKGKNNEEIAAAMGVKARCIPQIKSRLKKKGMFDRPDDELMLETC